jgi:hypothetical protein
MKKIISHIIIVLFILNALNAQKLLEKNVKGNYMITANYNAKYSIDNDNKSKTNVQIKNGTKIQLVNYSKGDNIVKFKCWNYINSKDSALYNDKIFEMSATEFDEMSVPFYSKCKGTTVGVYAVPFRLRDIGGKRFDFESSLSLQANMVFGFGKSTSPESWFDASFGIGLTSVNLNSNNSNVTEARTASAFTLSIGGVYKPTSFANIGIFFGIDNLPATDKATNWIYDGKLWFGLGINISFNEIKNTNEEGKFSN